MKGKKVLVTGATGLIGQAIIKRLLSENQVLSEPVQIAALIRNPEKGRKIFGEDYDKLIVVEFTMEELPITDEGYDYIIHAAANTSSKAFIGDPVGVINGLVAGTQRVLELGKVNQVESLVYLSSMEVYGTPSDDTKITEQSASNLNTMEARSSYPEGKRLCENLCASYASEYGVNAKVVRLTQTFGPGVQYDDGRVFAEFARCAIEHRDIVLKTKGETKRNYLYIDDAVDAILTVLLKGEKSEAYNAANEETYCSIYEMAKLVAEKCAGGSIDVKIEEADINQFGYAKTLHMNLDTRKLRNLGWSPKVGLKSMFDYLIESMKENR